MRKLIILLAVLTVVFSLVGCSSDDLLKDTDEAGAGYGAVIVKDDLIVKDLDGNKVTEVDTSAAEVKINNQAALLGEKIENIKSGEQTINVSLTDSSTNKFYRGEKEIVVEANQDNMVGGVEVNEVATNGYKFTFDPSTYSIDPANIDDVYLVGPFNDWTEEDMTYRLTKDEGQWKGVFDLVEGDKFKWYVKGNNLDDNYYPSGMSGELVVGEASSVQAVLAYKFTFKPSEYGVELDNIDNIYLTGPLNEWAERDATYKLAKAKGKEQWVGVFNVLPGEMFKWYVSGSVDSNYLPSGMGSEMEVGAVQWTELDAQRGEIEEWTTTDDDFSDDEPSETTSTAYKFTFNPSDYGLDPTNISNVSLSGPFNDWAADASTYNLVKSGEQWKGVFDIAQGEQFKWYVDGTHYPTGMGGEMTVDTSASGITEVEAYQFVFTPSDYGLDPTNISNVSLSGPFNDWPGDASTYNLVKAGEQWIAVFDIAQGEQFKWYVDDTHYPTGMGGELTVDDTTTGVNAQF